MPRQFVRLDPYNKRMQPQTNFKDPYREISKSDGVLLGTTVGVGVLDVQHVAHNGLNYLLKPDEVQVGRQKH